jgi:SAM-dependent methyltransferase
LRAARGLSESPSKQERLWETLAVTDPLWAIASEGMAASNVDAFFASGEEEVRRLLALLEELRATVSRGKALDFGCGAGRITRALSSHFDSVVGADHASGMVELARRLNSDIRNAEFVRASDTELASWDGGEFDLVWSVLTLQHVPGRERRARVIEELVRICRPGGLVVFQVPERVALRIRFHPFRVLSRQFPSAASRVTGLRGHTMTLGALSREDVAATLEAAGADALASVSDNRTGTSHLPSVGYVARVRGV